MTAEIPLTRMTSINAAYGQYFIVFCLLVCCFAAVFSYGRWKS